MAELRFPIKSDSPANADLMFWSVVGQETLSRAIVQVLQAPEVKPKLLEGGFSVLGTTRADTTRMVRSEAQRWAQVVKARAA